MATANSPALVACSQSPFPFGSRFIRVSQAATFLGVSEQQVRLLVDSGQIKSILTTGKHRRLDSHDCFLFGTGLTVQEATETPATSNVGRLIGLCRVSGRKQAVSNGDNKSSLEHQADHVKDWCRKKYGREPDEMLLHQRSGLNFSHADFLGLIRRIVSGELRGSTLVLTHPDRLARGARQLIEFLCESFQVKIDYVFRDDNNVDAQAEMIQDFIDTATWYTARNSARKSALVTRIDLTPEHLELAFKKKKRGETYSQISEFFKAKGMVSERGKPYSAGTVRKCLVKSWDVLEMAMTKKD